jgi:hypothetical protein
VYINLYLNVVTAIPYCVRKVESKEINRGNVTLGFEEKGTGAC